MRHIAVFRALQLGDMLCAVPALRALRKRFADASITLVGLPWAASFARRFSSYVDAFVPFPGFPGFPERAPETRLIPDFLQRMQSSGLDLAVQMHGSGRLSNPLVSLFAARRVAVLCAHDAWCPPDHERWPYPHDAHEIRRNLAVVRQLGADTSDESMAFPLLPEDHAELEPYPALRSLAREPYVCLHAGARAASKRWPADRFAAVGDALAARGYTIVLTGSAAERGVTAAVMARMRAPAVDAACEISVGGLAALLAGARLVVSNDTGASHLAAALHVPSVVIFFSTDPARWAPLDRARHRVIHDPAGVDVATVLDAAYASLDAARARSRGV